MIFVGIKKDKDRANIIKYLQSLEQINYINTMFIINKYILINIKILISILLLINIAKAEDKNNYVHAISVFDKIKYDKNLNILIM